MKKKIRTIDRSTLAEVLSTYEVVSAFLGWLEVEGYGIRGPNARLVDNDDLVERYATDNEAELAALRDILERYE